jgi:hypothetical protein
MKSRIIYSDPREILGGAETEMEPIPNEELFNSPQYQKLKERWCAGMFGVGYSMFVGQCEVAVNASSYREDVDIFLRAKDREWEFQLAEVQEPGRQRGREYAQFADGKVRTLPYEPERGRIEGPKWLAEGVRKKKEKNYSGSKDMQLLLYANFPAQELEHSEIIKALEQFKSDFASIWVVTSMHVCSIFSPQELGQINGWGVVRSVRHYYS